MNVDRQTALCYLRAPPGGLWKWADAGSVVVWQDGSTIAFREELVAIIEWLQPHGLPSFGAIVLLLAALRGKVPEEAQILGAGDGELPLPLSEKAQILCHARRQLKLQLGAALQELRKLSRLPQELRAGLKAKCVLAEAIFETARAERHGAGQQILRGWSELLPDTELNGSTDEPGAHQAIRQIHLLAEGLKRHTAESLTLRLRTGLDALPAGVDVGLSAAERARRLIDDLSRDPEHGAVARAARDLMPAIRLPRHLGAPEDLAIGGVADLTNRGPLDRLLLSELAHDDLTLAVRIALNEALYLRREPPAREPPGILALLLDSGLRLWGIPRVLAGAVALAFAASEQRQAQVLAWRARGRSVCPVDLISRQSLIEHFSNLDVEVHPGAALPAFTAALPPGPQVQTVVITHPDALQDAEFRRALQAHPVEAGFVATVDRAGRFELHSLPLARRPPLCQAELDLNKVFGTEGPAVSLINLSRQPGLPAIFGVSPFPLRLPFAGVVERWTADRSGENFAELSDRRLIRFRDVHSGGRLLAAGLPPGKTVWMGVVDGAVHLVKAGTIKRPVRLVSVPTDGGPARVLELQTGTELLGAHVSGDVLLLFRSHKIRAIGLADGRPLGGTIHAYRHVQGRFFASDAGFYCATWDGQGVRLEPVSLPNSYSPSVIAHIFDREGWDGPWIVHRNGEISSTATGQKFQLPLPPGIAYGLDTVHVSPGGDLVHATIAASPGRRTAAPVWSSTLDLRTGAAADRSAPRPFAAPPELEWQWLLDLPRWNLYRVQDAISASPEEGISLCGRKGRWRNLRCVDGQLQLCAARDLPGSVRRCVVFAPCPAPASLGCTLQVASWVGGSKAFLDSRGLLHLKSRVQSLPEISLVLAENELAGWTSDGHVCGPRFFIGDQRSDPAKVWTAVTRFFQEL